MGTWKGVQLSRKQEKDNMCQTTSARAVKGNMRQVQQSKRENWRGDGVGGTDGRRDGTGWKEKRKKRETYGEVQMKGQSFESLARLGEIQRSGLGL